MEQKQADVVEIDLLELFYVLLGKLHILILALFLGASCAFFISTVLITPKYQSSTSIYVLNKQDSNSVTYTDLQTGAQLTKDYAELVVSRSVMEKVITKCKLNEKYNDMKDLDYKDLADMVRVENKTDTRIITITVTDTDPGRAQDIANAVREAASIHITSVMDIEAVNVVDYAEMPMEKVSPKIIKMTAIGGVVGVMIAVAIVIIVHLTDDRIKTPDDIEKYLGISLLGTIPYDESYVTKKK